MKKLLASITIALLVLAISPSSAAAAESCHWTFTMTGWYSYAWTCVADNPPVAAVRTDPSVTETAPQTPHFIGDGSEFVIPTAASNHRHFLMLFTPGGRTFVLPID